jgi:glycogen debranching enzyme
MFHYLKILVLLGFCLCTGCGQAESPQSPYKWRSATQEESAPAQQPVIDGYPVANFALTANASADGSLYGHIMQNPGQLGDWLASKGAVTLSIEKDGRGHSFSGFNKKTVQRAFPFVKNTYEQSPLTPVTLSLTTFCPLAVNDAITSSLPALLLELTCTNPTSRTENFTVAVTPETLMAEGAKAVSTSRYSGVANVRHQISCNSATQWTGDALHIPVTLNGHEEKTLRIALFFYDEQWISANQFTNVGELAAFVYKTWPALKEKTALFDAAIPQTGDAELDDYLRWYLIPGISLTKYTKNNEILTMGYRELNQRDSYWTSWLHLALFKEAERTMIEESIAWQQPSGKIPTTILPLIERDDDLDINAFFILRVARFYQYYSDSDRLAAYWPAMKKAMEWLLSRDSSGDGLPVQVSFWGDWKDVGGVQGRKYSPFSGLIYLAALKQMVFLSRQIGDATSAEKYQAAYQKGSTFINRTIGDGGLWNGNYYCQRWHDGTVNNHLLQDQMIGVLFGVVPQERAEAIIRSLNEKSLTAYGIAETTPYYPASWGYEPATYHNGGVWPWLSFMDCWARIRLNRTAEAIALVKKVAHADLVASGDWSPNEHINSLTGENLGFQLQGWNAGLFGLVYFGLLHQNIIP